MGIAVPIYGAIYLLATLCLPVCLGLWGLRTWLRAEERFPHPLWRSRLALAAFLVSNISAAIWLFVLVWIYAFGKRFPYYDPTLLGFYRLGFLTGLCGFFLGIGAKGKLRWPAVAAGIFMAAAWFLAASQE